MLIQNDYSLLHLNTFGINCVAARYVELEGSADYEELLMSGLLKDTPFFILGGGSNVVLPDRYEGTVIHPVNKGVSLVAGADSLYVEAEAGEVWADFVNYCVSQGWHGTENLAGIPGCVGAAPVQNVGAYGSEAKDIIYRVHVWDLKSGIQRWLDASECGFAYRWSVFKGELKNRCIVDRVMFRLSDTFVPVVNYQALTSRLASLGIATPSARQMIETVVALRNSKLPDPAIIGSAGSFFKNPVVSETEYLSLKERYPDIVAFRQGDDNYKIAAGWLIEQCGWKGRTLGRAGVYEKQSLVLVNRGGCTASDVRGLSDAIIADVEHRFGVTLSPEAIFV